MKRLSLLIIIFSLLVTCTNGQNEGANIEQQNIQNGAYDSEGDDYNSHAERLEQLAERIPQVHRATCVVLGPLAIVGIDVDGKLERSKVDTVKYSVAEALRNDPLGVDALVTADIDLYQRLVEIRDQARNGQPIAGFANELAEIIGRIMPQFPSDTIPQTDPQTEPMENDDV